MTIVYWRIKQSHPGLKIEFWTKEDRKDLFVEDFVIVEESRLRFRVAQKLKITLFELEQVGKK